jgi:simple sugar transport system ATP-binding protein
MENSPDPAPSLLEVRGISKSFGAVRALQEVDFTLRAGEIHALLGENGAGKSTMIKVITGVFPRDAGIVRLGGEEVAPRSAKAALQAGIATVYQEVNCCRISRSRRTCSSTDSRCASASCGRRDAASRQDASHGLRPRYRRRRAARQLFRRHPARHRDCARGRSLRPRADPGRADGEPRPSRGRDLFGIMRQLAKRGIGIVFVSHFLDQVYEISDRITVLRNGRLVGSARPPRCRGSS